MTAPQEINRLIERFQENRDVYCSSQYNEAQARHEFIDPFFKALGWDMTNEKGYSKAYNDVVHENAIKIVRQAATLEARNAPYWDLQTGAAAIGAKPHINYRCHSS